MIAIGHNLSHHTSSDDEEDGEDKDDDEEDSGLGKLSEDDEPGWVIGTIPKTVQHRMESFRLKHICFEKLMQLGWGDAANNYCERAMRYRMPKLKVPAVGKAQADITAATSSPTTFGQLMQRLEIVHGESQMP